MELMSQELDRVLREVLSQRSYDAHCALVEEFRERTQEHGGERARLWLEARDFRPGRRVQPPPNGWDWVQYVQAREPVPEAIRGQLRSFWGWYLPLEVRAMKLVRLMFRAEELGETEIHSRLYAVADGLHGQLEGWRTDGGIPWLPKDRGSHWRGGSLIDLLSMALTASSDVMGGDRAC